MSQASSHWPPIWGAKYPKCEPIALRLTGPRSQVRPGFGVWGGECRGHCWPVTLVTAGLCLGAGSALGSSPNRSEVAVQPFDGFARRLGPRERVPGLVDDQFLVFGAGSQQLEVGQL